MNLKPISISLSPDTEKDDILLSFKLIFQPWKWKAGRGIEKLEEGFKNYLGIKHAISFNSGRSSLMAILSSLELKKDDEVLLQAFTCNAVPNPIIWTGLKPVYVDVNEQTFNIDAEDLKKKITPKSKVAIVQHVFGLPADMAEIIKICQENNLILIEDCAHSLGAEYKEKKVGTMGRISFFSFSRDKVISSVYGGMVATSDDELAKRIRLYQEKIGYPSYFWILQQLLHPVLMNWLILPVYKYFGKYFFVLFQELNILSKAVVLKEKIGQKPDYFSKRMPNALAILAQNQIKKINRFNLHRQEIAKFYYDNLRNSNFKLPVSFPDTRQIFLRFSVKHLQAHKIIRKAWDNNLLIGDWYTTSIAPDYNKLEKIKYGKNLRPSSDNVGYCANSCPVAEKLAKITLNLPTHINISKNDAKIIVEFLEAYGN
jgi:dTDP-4-amino-4,6-dideoxygalactose transaminase